jgi:hypothetical protein
MRFRRVPSWGVPERPRNAWSALHRICRAAPPSGQTGPLILPASPGEPVHDAPPDEAHQWPQGGALLRCLWPRRPAGLLPQRLPVALRRAGLHLDQLGARGQLELVGIGRTRRPSPRHDRRRRMPWDSASWAMLFVPAYWEGSSLHGEGAHSYVSDFNGWNTSNTVAAHDMAVLRLYEPVGSWLGWMAPTSTTPAGRAAHTGRSPATPPRLLRRSARPISRAFRCSSTTTTATPESSSTMATPPAVTRVARSSRSWDDGPYTVGTTSGGDRGRGRGQQRRGRGHGHRRPHTVGTDQLDVTAARAPARSAFRLNSQAGAGRSEEAAGPGPLVLRAAPPRQGTGAFADDRLRATCGNRAEGRRLPIMAVPARRFPTREGNPWLNRLSRRARPARPSDSCSGRGRTLDTTRAMSTVSGATLSRRSRPFQGDRQLTVDGMVG